MVSDCSYSINYTFYLMVSFRNIFISLYSSFSCFSIAVYYSKMLICHNLSTYFFTFGNFSYFLFFHMKINAILSISINVFLGKVLF